jgi:hypothetical protein
MKTWEGHGGIRYNIYKTILMKNFVALVHRLEAEATFDL